MFVTFHDSNSGVKRVVEACDLPVKGLYGPTLKDITAALGDALSRRLTDEALEHAARAYVDHDSRPLQRLFNVQAYASDGSRLYCAQLDWRDARRYINPVTGFHYPQFVFEGVIAAGLARVKVYRCEKVERALSREERQLLKEGYHFVIVGAVQAAEERRQACRMGKCSSLYDHFYYREKHLESLSCTQAFAEAQKLQQKNDAAFLRAQEKYRFTKLEIELRPNYTDHLYLYHDAEPLLRIPQEQSPIVNGALRTILVNVRDPSTVKIALERVLPLINDEIEMEKRRIQEQNRQAAPRPAPALSRSRELRP